MTPPTQPGANLGRQHCDRRGVLTCPKNERRGVLAWTRYRMGVMRMTQVVIAGLQTRRGQQRALFEIEEAA